MKKLHIYIETQKGIKDLEAALAELAGMGVEVCVHSLLAELKEMENCLQKTKETRPGQIVDRTLCLPCFQDKEDALIVTDVPQFASMLAAGGYPVLAYVHEGNKGCSLPHVKYVIEGFEDVDGGYFWRVWQRLTGKPWYITETERCIIRETCEDDVDTFYEIYSEPSITAYMENLFAEKDAELQYVKDYREKVYEFYGFGMWTVLDKESGQVIGRAGISMREGYEEPELGFLIAKPFQGKGIAAEVCDAVLKFAQKEFGFVRFQALVHKDNLASLRVLQKLGFTYERTVVERGETLELYICAFPISI
ncbi:MAG: GNAT family N-acetyltransferase [Lachnospiraceae bacterium]|nr:GNAT family N-acetyltransferase [Lachnospiraceae bacterium]